MNTCLKCHRPLKRPTESGYGPVCAKAVQTVSEVERDLFGYDVDAAILSAQVRLAEYVDNRCELDKFQIRRSFNDARKRLGVWA